MKELLELATSRYGRFRIRTYEDLEHELDCGSIYHFKTWKALMDSEKEETYPFTEEECKQFIGKDIFQLSDGSWVWFIE